MKLDVPHPVGRLEQMFFFEIPNLDHRQSILAVLGNGFLGRLASIHPPPFSDRGIPFPGARSLLFVDLQRELSTLISNGNGNDALPQDVERGVIDYLRVMTAQQIQIFLERQ